MAINKAIGFVGALALVGCGLVACSSSDSGTTTPVTDAGTTRPDAGPVKVPDASGGGTSDTGAAAACIAKDDISGYTTPPMYAAAKFGANVCTQAQYGAFIAACVDSATAKDADCQAVQNDAANDTCFACVITAEDAATGTGPLLVDAQGQLVDVNRVGCLEHYKAGCGKAFFDSGKCVDYACDSNKGGNCDGAVTAELQSCQSSAQAGACKAKVTASQTTCAIKTGDAASSCFAATGETTKTYLSRFFSLFCGGAAAASDAGPG